VRAGVDDSVRDVVGREIRIIRMTVKGELEDACSWELKLVAKSMDI
jgi:hypothetical protein